MEAYCFKCRAKVTIEEPQARHALRTGALLPREPARTCDTKVFRIGKAVLAVKTAPPHLTQIGLEVKAAPVRGAFPDGLLCGVGLADTRSFVLLVVGAWMYL